MTNSYIWYLTPVIYYTLSQLWNHLLLMSEFGTLRMFSWFSDTETDALVASSRHLSPINFPPVWVANDLIVPPATVKNLGIIFDTNMIMQKQISSVARQFFLFLRDMYKVCLCLPLDATETLVHSFVSTRLDYCNSLYFGLAKTLQFIQNTGACLVTNTGKYEHPPPILESLHWLPVGQCIISKFILITYKCLHGFAPAYFKDLLNITPNSGFHSADKAILLVPRSSLMSYGDSAFSHAALHLWNYLPSYIRL